MADQKVSDLPSLNGADVDPADLLYIVDSSAGSAGSKKITVGQYQLAPVSGGTANGVVYLNGSKVVTTGSGLVFDGTNFSTTGTATATKLIPTGGSATGNGMYLPAANTLAFSTNGTEALRIDASRNLGLDGTSPSAWFGYKALQSQGFALYLSNAAGTFQGGLSANSYLAGAGSSWTRINAGTTARYDIAVGIHKWYADAAGVAGASFTPTERMQLDNSGNIGLNGTSPSAWYGYKVLQNGNVSFYGSGFALGLSSNAYLPAPAATWTTVSTGATARYEISQGIHKWYGDASAAGGSSFTPTERMQLDNSGNLGIGTSSPGARLETVASGSAIYFSGGDSAGARRLQFNATTTTNTGDTQNINALGSTGVLAFSTNSSERARITSGGDLLVGTTNASVGTAVGCRIVDSGARLEVAKAASTNSDIGLSQYSTSAAAYRFYVGYGGTIYATSTTITAISDQRLKENIRDLDAGLSEVMALKPRKFDWKAGKGKDKKNDRGWIAQEFEQVFPDMVDTWQDPAPEGEEPYKAVNADLIPVLVKAIQEQQAIIEDLRARVAALESA